MNITLEMLLTHYFELHPDSVVSYNTPQRSFAGIRLLPPPDPSGSMLYPDPKYLYVSDQIDMGRLRSYSGNLCIIAAGETTVSEDESFQLIAIPTEGGISGCFNDLQNSFDYFAEWEHALDFAINRQTSFQELIQLSESVISSPMMVYDPALKLLAWSRSHKDLKDPIFQDAIRNGFLDMEAVHYFEKMQAFARMKEEGSASGEADSYHAHADYMRSVNVNNQLAVYGILLHTDTSCRSYEKQLFDILCDAFRRILENQHTAFERERSVTDYFLMDLLDNPETTAEKIRERTQYLDLNFEDSYVLFYIASDIQKKTAEHFFIQQLRSNMINCHIFPYKEGILVLYILPKASVFSYRSYLMPELTRIAHHFPNNTLQIGVSKPFFSLATFAEAWHQASRSVSLAPGEKRDSICFYEDWWIRDLLSQTPGRNPVYFYCEICIADLIRKNTKKARQQLTILEEYLNQDRNYTNTSQKLGMHRNNVIYHIQKIEEEYHLDLDDSKTRLKLLLSFEMLKMLKVF